MCGYTVKGCWVVARNSDNANPGIRKCVWGGGDLVSTLLLSFIDLSH